ncbi:MAG TPA: GntR family transcriptional regulator [Bauldia sp.]|nr:GntR family transcriptional regulator [Bauldia sp.]
MSDSAASLDRLPSRQLQREDGPLYRQLASLLRVPIMEGTYPIGMPLPKEAEIAGRFGISLITVRQALRDLESDGLIKKRPAKPAVVAARVPAPKLSSAFRNFADIAAYTRDARLHIVSYRREALGAAGALFGLGSEEIGYCLRAILIVAGRKEAQITTRFPPAVGRRLKRSAFDDVLIFRAVQRHLGIRLEAARITVRAEVADRAVAADLDYASGAPILAMEMLYHSTDRRPIEFTIARHRGDVFSLVYDAPNDIA